MRLKAAIWVGFLIVSNILIATAQEDANVIESETETAEEDTTEEAVTEAVVTEATTTTTSTTTTKYVEPAGSVKTFAFTSATAGLTVSIDFTQQEDDTLEMHCVIATDLTELDTLKKFCKDPNPPEIWMVQGHTDCSSLPTDEDLPAEKIGSVQKPNEDVTEKPNFQWSDLEGNCLLFLQSNAVGAEKTSSNVADCAVLFEEAEEETATDAAEESEAAEVTTVANEVDDVIVEDSERIGARGARFLMHRPRVLTRLFANTINLGSFTLLSAGSVYVAPTIVNAALPSPVVTFGNFGGYTYNPWSTLPYLQLPGWTVSTIYTIVFGLFILYIFGLLGSYIPGVSDFTNSIATLVADSTASRRFNRFVAYSVDRTFDGLTTFVHNGINRFARRNTYQRPRPQYTRRTDVDYEYYAYDEADQHYAENQYFRK